MVKKTAIVIILLSGCNYETVSPLGLVQFSLRNHEER